MTSEVRTHKLIFFFFFLMTAPFQSGPDILRTYSAKEIPTASYKNDENAAELGYPIAVK